MTKCLQCQAGKVVVEINMHDSVVCTWVVVCVKSASFSIRYTFYFESLNSYFERLNSYFESSNSYFGSLNSYFKCLNSYFCLYSHLPCHDILGVLTTYENRSYTGSCSILTKIATCFFIYSRLLPTKKSIEIMFGLSAGIFLEVLHVFKL